MERRYTQGDLKGLTKEQLISLMELQPEHIPKPFNRSKIRKEDLVSCILAPHSGFTTTDPLPDGETSDLDSQPPAGEESDHNTAHAEVTGEDRRPASTNVERDSVRDPDTKERSEKQSLDMKSDLNSEVSESIFKNIRVYWLAFVVYWGMVLFGYDTGVGGGVVSAPFFQSHFDLIRFKADGVTKDQSRVDAVSSNVVSVLQAGAVFGALGSAPLSSKFGRRWTLLAFSAVFSVGAILTTVADNLAEIYAGRVISGVGIGAISAVAPAYVSECSPKEVRGRITGMFQIMVSFGVMISYFVNFGVGMHIANSPNVWRIPFGFQLVPAGIMVFGVLTVRESPRWLAQVGRNQEALENLAYLRRDRTDSPAILHEMVEIETAILEEREARKGLGLKEASSARVISSVSLSRSSSSSYNNGLVKTLSSIYYAPQIFASIGFTARKNSLLASGIYGLVKLVATSLFILFGVEFLGRKLSLFISAMGMGTLFFIIGAILKTHPPPAVDANHAALNPPPASKAMAAMLYIYVCFYSMGWGPLPWVYVSDVFPTRTRHYGLSLASASQWLWNFVVSKVTPTLSTDLGYKMFLMFGSINIGCMAMFSLLIPETKGRSLEEMDVIFGSVTSEQRKEDIERREREIQRIANSTPSSAEKV